MSALLFCRSLFPSTTNTQHTTQRLFLHCLTDAAKTESHPETIAFSFRRFSLSPQYRMHKPHTNGSNGCALILPLFVSINNKHTAHNKIQRSNLHCLTGAAETESHPETSAFLLCRFFLLFLREMQPTADWLRWGPARGEEE